jgi:site-specific DNA-methyltransferase (adenine-specific)
MKVARQLGRNSIGIEIKKSLIPIIKKKVDFEGQLPLDNQNDTFEISNREVQ